MTDVFRVARVLVEHAVRVHGDAVAIIAYYGSRARGMGSATSDLDIFYIPEEGQAGSLCTQFVLDGLPYDFWPVSWRTAERVANAESDRPWAFSASLLADAKVLHACSPEDRARFEALQARIAELTRPEQRGLMIGKALDAFPTALHHLGQMQLAAARGDRAGLQGAGFDLANGAVNCLALVNQVYLRRGWGADLAEVREMQQRPADLEAMLSGLMLPEGPDQALQQATRLVGEVREVLLAAQQSTAEVAAVGEVFRDYYFFVHEYVAKIVSACAREQRLAAAAAALALQRELCEQMSKVTDGAPHLDFHLLGEYQDPYLAAGFPDLLGPAGRGELTELAARARELQEKVAAWLGEHGVDLNVLASEDDLPPFLDARDPARPDSGTTEGEAR
jgi:hypothetical protein